MIPAKFCGVWKRAWEQSPPGTLADDTSTVLWLQTPCGIYVDLRLPYRAPGTVVTPVDLAAQKSFAGFLTAEGDRATWHRHIDFQPPSGLYYAGRISV